MDVIYSNIIIKPIVSEKTMSLQAQNNTYVFKVDKKANKLLVKQAVENLFEVKVDKVNIVNYRKKKKRVGKYLGAKASYKKAYVKLEPGQLIGGEEKEQDSEEKPLVKKLKKKSKEKK